jgi:hypothetical protein
LEFCDVAFNVVNNTISRGRKRLISNPLCKEMIITDYTNKYQYTNKWVTLQNKY